jgi:NAD(P)-dependent dehydrogenase (short-subunit alcohol dehydrogenase family)
MKNKVIVVTGAAGTLGTSILKFFANEGAQLAAIDKLPPEHITGATLPLGNVDLTDPQSANSAFTKIRDRFGEIDGLLNVAGAFRWETIEDGNIMTWDFLYSVNLKSAVIACTEALPLLIKKQGSIVNIGANAAARGSVGMGAYTASKAGVVRLTESLADELKGRGVRVNALLPSIIDTPQNRADIPAADHSTWVSPEAIAKIAAFLFSPASEAITGACIPVTGLV